MNKHNQTNKQTNKQQGRGPTSPNRRREIGATRKCWRYGTEVVDEPSGDWELQIIPTAFTF